MESLALCYRAGQCQESVTKCCGPVAVYCGSIPEFEPRYTALQDGSVASNLQFCGSSWTTEEEASFQSILTTQMKKQLSFWDGVVKSPCSRASSSLDGWASQDSVHDFSAGDGGDLFHLFHQDLTWDSQEREVSRAALETIRIENKLKMRRMSDSLLASQRGLTDCSDPKRVTLKPLISRSASQRLPVIFKPMSRIQNGLPSSQPRRMNNGEQEHEEDGTGCDEIDGNNKELKSEGKEYKASLQPLCCSDEDGKKSLGVSLIPPIPKSARPSDGVPGSAAAPLPSSQQLVFQEALRMRPRSGSGSEKKTPECLELRTPEPLSPALQHCVGGVKPAGHLCEPLPPLTHLPLIQAKETDQLVRSHLLSDDDSKDSNGRICVTLSKSAQKKIQQKRMREMELLHREREKEREKEKSLQFPTLSVDPEDAAEESSGLPPVNGRASIAPSMRNAYRQSSGITMGKRVNRPSLPSIPAVRQGGSFPRRSSANSLPAMALDIVESGNDPECEAAQEARPFPYTEQGLIEALAWLSGDDWRQKARALFSIRHMAVCQPEVLLSRLHDVSLAVNKEVNNLRSRVCRCAIVTLGELFRTMKKHMDHEVDEVARVLLQRVGDTSEFIQKAADESLGVMVGSVTPARAMTALMASGVQHRNVLVRKCAAKHLLTVMERIGAEKLLSGTPSSIELLVRTLVKLAQDCHQDTRCCGRKMLSILMSHKNFHKHLKQFVPSRDLEDVMAKIKQKEEEDRKCGPPPAKDPRKYRNLRMHRNNLPHDEGLRSGSDLPRQRVRCTSLRTVEENEQLMELDKLLRSTDFRTRIEGTMLLLDHCKSSPQLISTNIVQIFDIFMLRLQDYNKKVRQKALEVLALMISMLRGALNPVLISVVAAVTDNLNSKNSGIHAAAMKVLEASTAHLDNTLLLQNLSQRVNFLSGQAMLVVAEQLSVLVPSVYPRKPHTVKRYVLPVLWFFLGNNILPVRSSNVKAVVAKLAKSLYQVMGLRLKEHAATQSRQVVKNLCDILDLTVE
ncbi:TOG array regulator of axonemal microtubules protein 2 [Chroicocephalus ridibundus]